MSAVSAARGALLLQNLRRAEVSQNPDGEWMCNGEVVKCSLGGHEGMARSRANGLDVAALFASASLAERERMFAIGRAGFNSIEDLLQ